MKVVKRLGSSDSFSPLLGLFDEETRILYNINNWCENKEFVSWWHKNEGLERDYIPVDDELSRLIDDEKVHLHHVDADSIERFDNYGYPNFVRIG